MRPTLLICPLLLAFATSTDATTHFVNAAAAPGGDGSSWSLAFADLQDALAVAQAGDEIWVAEGTYKPGDGTDRTASFHLVSGVGLYGGFAGSETLREQRDWVAQETVLSGQIGEPDPNPFQPGDDICNIVTAYHVDAATILDGFTITRGFAAPVTGASSSGGGMVIRGGSPIIRNSRVEHCIAHYRAGGVYISEAATPTFENVTIAKNAASHSVGGVLNESTGMPRFIDVEFRDNDGNFNSGAMWGRGEFVDCQFVNNESLEGPSTFFGQGTFTRVLFSGNKALGAGGGWLACAVAATGTFTDVVFENNLMTGYYEGSGAFIGSGTLTNVRFVGNQAPGVGAMLITGPSTLTNVLIAGNRGCSSSIWVGSTPPYHPYGEETPFTAPVRLINVTVLGGGFSGEIGPALHSRGQPVEIMNSIVIGDIENLCLPPDAYEDVSNSTVSISHSLVEGSGGSGLGWNSDYGVDLGGNLDLAPLFANPVAGDYALIQGSPGIDAGLDSFLPVGLLSDLAHDPRIYGERVDMGAYELQVPNCASFEVTFGNSWDGPSLQEVLDAEYGVGQLDAALDYEGANCADAAVPYWIDSAIDAWLVRTIAGSEDHGAFGWYVESFGPPNTLGPIFDATAVEGESASVVLPSGTTRFGFYLGSGTERRFTNRFLNAGAPQCLIYNLTALRGGTPTYLLAWEQSDAASPISPSPGESVTDNDFQDLVVEIAAMSPVPAAVLSLEARVVDASVQLQWDLRHVGEVGSLEIRRRDTQGGLEERVARWVGQVQPTGTWTDRSLPSTRVYEYVAVAELAGTQLWSDAVRASVDSPAVVATRLLRAVPNPFNPQTRLEFTLDAPSDVKLRIYDLAGREVRTLELGPRPAGAESALWNGQDDSGRTVASGVYVARLVAGRKLSELRVVMVK